MEGGCVEAPAPMARSINYGFVTYPLHLRPGGHVVVAWLDSVGPSHDVVSSTFEVTAFCERDADAVGALCAEMRDLGLACRDEGASGSGAGVPFASPLCKVRR